MDIKKALIASFIWYAAMFLLASALMLVVSDIAFEVSTVILSVILIYIISKYYYFNKKVKDPLKEGLMFGIVIDAVSFILDTAIMVYGFAIETGWNYFLAWNLMAGYMLVLVIPIFVAYQMK